MSLRSFPHHHLRLILFTKLNGACPVSTYLWARPHLLTHSMRRCPVYLLIDTSGSMKGEPIESVRVGLDAMLASLRQDPFALESCYLSIITFDSEVHQLLPLTPLEQVKVPTIITPDAGPTHLGAALELLCDCIDKEVKLSTPTSKGDWMPLLFIMTDGKPSDISLYDAMCSKIQSMRFGCVVACAAGMMAKTEPLQRLTHQVYTLDTLDSTSFKQFFQWVSNTIGVGNRSIGAIGNLTLPPPPAEVNILP